MMESNITYLHNSPFQPGELIELFDAVGFNRLGEWKPEYLDDIFRHTNHYVIAKENDHLVGFVRLLTDWHTRGYISDLCVVPRLQNRGIGQRMMSEMLAICDARRVAVLNLYDTSANRDFYQGFGFISDRMATGLHRIHPDSRR